ncbi:YihY/virulence factor BrkB family protein [Leucobacter zeae]|nr:YihY/virulence factor BrkB family protein [Leucobacter zeae]
MTHESGRAIARGTAPGLVPRLIAWALRRRAVRAYLRYAEHRGSQLADSITYRALFSLFAAVLLGFSLAALWLGRNPEAMGALADALDRTVPGLTRLVDPERIDAPAGFTIAGAISVVGLVAAAIGAIGSLRAAFRVLADEFHDDASFVSALLRNFAVAVAFGGLLVVSAVLGAAGPAGIATVLSWIGVGTGADAVGWLTHVFSVCVMLAIDALAIALAFRLLSGVRAPVRALWGGALLGGAGLVVLQELSGLFVRGASANPLFAAFAALVALLIWVNLSAQVILLAGSYIVTAAAEAHDRVREVHGAATLAQHRRRRAEDRLRAATLELRAAQEAERAERADADAATRPGDGASGDGTSSDGAAARR